MEGSSGLTAGSSYLKGARGEVLLVRHVAVVGEVFDLGGQLVCDIGHDAQAEPLRHALPRQ